MRSLVRTVYAGFITPLLKLTVTGRPDSNLLPITSTLYLPFYGLLTFGATGRNRTGTPLQREILSLLCLPISPQSQTNSWWAPRESNTAPMDYESTALTNMS